MSIQTNNMLLENNNLFFNAENSAGDENNVYHEAIEYFEGFENDQEIKLLDHQKTVIKYLVSQKREQKGILVNHYQGTGKTLTGIFFMKNYPNKKKIIMAPEALKSMWQIVCTKNQLTNKIYFISYEFLEELRDVDITEFYEKIEILNNIIKDGILVSDESHNIVQLLDFCQSMASWTLDDLTNLTLLPKHMLELKEQNENIISYRNKLKKYLELFNNCKKLLFLTGTPVKKNVEDIRWFINLSAGKMVVPYVMQDFNVKYIKQNKLYENIEKIAIPFLELFNININIPDDYNSSGIEKYRSNIMMIVDEILSNNRIPQNPIINKVIKKMLGNSIINTIKLYIEKYMTDELNISQIDWGNYISYYKYDNLDYYPKALPKIRSVDYTDYQYDVWYKGNNNKLTDEESVILMFNENQEDARLFKPYTKEDINKKQGTIIGNMTSKDQYPSKFIKIIQDYEENKLNGKFLRTLVYSNYYESGIKLFAAYLDEKEIEYKIYDKPLKTWTQEQIKDNNKNMLDFENGELTLLLLHPAYFEGFSIRKVRRFHILEPIDSYYMKEQLYTRVVRYKSHTDLPIEERNVTIIQWYCTFKNLTGYINKNLILGKNLEFKFNDLEFEGSPDDILMKKVNSHETMLNDVSKALKEKSIENSVELIDTCCIFNEKCDSKLQKCEALEGGKNKQSIEFF